MLLSCFESISSKTAIRSQFHELWSRKLNSARNFAQDRPMERSVAHNEAVCCKCWPMFTSCVMGCDHFSDPDARLQSTFKMMSYDDGKHQFGCASSPQYRLPHREVNWILGFSLPRIASGVFSCKMCFCHEVFFFLPARLAIFLLLITWSTNRLAGH